MEGNEFTDEKLRMLMREKTIIKQEMDLCPGKSYIVRERKNGRKFRAILVVKITESTIQYNWNKWQRVSSVADFVKKYEIMSERKNF